MIDKREIIPVYGAHTQGREYFRVLDAAKTAKNSDLIPPVYSWPDVTNAHVRALRPTILALDSAAPHMPPRSIPYACPGDPFELKGDRRNLFLVGADKSLDSLMSFKRLDEVTKGSLDQYWRSNGMRADTMRMPRNLGGLADILPEVFLLGGTYFAPTYEQKAVLFGLNLLFISRLFMHARLMRLENRFQLSRRSPVFHTLLRLSRPMSYNLTTVDLRNAVNAAALTDTQNHLQDDQDDDGSTVVLFGTAHVLGENLWNDSERQRAVISREVEKIMGIAEKKYGKKGALDNKQRARFARDLSRYLGDIGIWRVKERPRIMTYQNFTNRVPLEDTFTSPTISSIVEKVVEIRS